MQRKDIPKNIPSEPGVYFFKKKRAKKPLYIGKATNLRDRVRSYFSADIERERGPWIKKMLAEADTVEVTQTDSVLEALLLETELIKKYKPKYNTKEKDDKSPNYIVVTKEAFPQILVMRGKELTNQDATQYKKIFGPFPSSTELKDALKIVRKIFPWRDGRCEPNQDVPCFNKQIGLCPGVCTGEISKKEYAFIIKNLIMFLSGKKQDVIKTLKKEMKSLAKEEKFEEAQVIRDKIFALEHIHDVALMRRERIRGTGIRMEGYDIAHLAGSDVVGVMTVMENGKLAKSEYRKFRIRSKKGIDDTGNLYEVLVRRFRHTEWPFPQVVVIDGGAAQVNVAERALKEFELPIKVVSVVKNKQHKPERFIGDRSIVRQYQDDIVLLNQEAHRFAVRYHKEKRNKSFLT